MMEYASDAMLHAEEAWPQESCGLITDRGYLRCENLAPDPCAAFRIDDRVVRRELTAGTLRAVVHSHPHPASACPSEADMRQQIAAAVPWGIVPVGERGDAGRPFWWGDGVDHGPLVGRPYRYGVTDCWSLIRDWYRVERGVELDDVPRAWAWWAQPDHPDHYQTKLPELGFVEVDRAEADIGDMLLIAIGPRAAVSHAGVIVEPGVMLHHPAGDRPWDPGRLSRRDPVARWIEHVRRVMRFAGA